MIQDLDFGKLDNQYHPQQPHDTDTMVCFRGGEVLLRRDEQGILHLPTWRQVSAWCSEWNCWNEQKCAYIFNLQEANFFLWMGKAGDCSDPDFAYEKVATLRLLR